MIPRPSIAKWQEYAPWNEFSQVEQDLIISWALVKIFSDDFLRENLAFRGGTALHKLYLHPAPRYSAVIDLVQKKRGPIKPIMQLNYEQIITCFKEYTLFATGKRPPSKKEFLMNIEEKAFSAAFMGDMEGLLRPDIQYNQSDAFDWLKKELVEKM